MWLRDFFLSVAGHMTYFSLFSFHLNEHYSVRSIRQNALLFSPHTFFLLKDSVVSAFCE